MSAESVEPLAVEVTEGDTALAATPATVQVGTVAHETTKALRNAFILTLSLIGTLGVAIAVRFWMPRYLGPDQFGQIYFAESFTAACFVFLNLGVDTYINREIATRAEHASDFIGGVIVLRSALTVVIFAVIAALLASMHKSPVEWGLVYIFAVYQLCFSSNNTLQSILNARGEVRELAIVNVVSKIVWGLAIVVALLFQHALMLAACAFVLTELGKTVALLALTRKYVKLELRWQVKPAIAIVVASLAYYLNHLAHDVYARVDSIMLSWMKGDTETAWYGAAVNINLLALLVLPIMNAVLMPMSSRVQKESPHELDNVMRSTLRIVLVLSVPLTLSLMLHAPAVVALLYGGKYAASARTLMLLAPVIPLSYICVVSAGHLVQLSRIWSVTRTSLIGLVVHPALNLVAIPYGAKLFGEGGAGTGAAAASLASELIVTCLFFVALGNRGPDRKFAGNIARLILACVLVTALHLFLPPLSDDPTHPITLWRLPVEAVVYVGFGSLIGAIPLRAMIDQVRMAMSRRRSKVA